MRMPCPRWLQVVVLSGLFGASTVAAQQAQPAPSTAPAPAPVPAPAPERAVTSRQPFGPLVPLDMQVVVSRYQGDKRVSSLPYSLAVNANDLVVSSLRMGARVPVPRGATAPPGLPPIEYQSIGTNIDCFARTMDDGRFQVNIVIEDSSIYAVLRDGQTRQFTAATDRVNGEVVRIEVTLRVVK